MYVYVAGVLETRAHRSHKHALYDIPPIRSAFHVGACILNKGVVQFSACVVFATSDIARYEH
jgi:Ni,Fe-hydrogenase III small subunit